MAQRVPTLCRLCIAHCGVIATVEDGRLSKVEGDPDNPMFKGYTCPKGRALAEMHNAPDRLLHSLRRDASGQQQTVPVNQAMDEIAAKLRQLIDQYGPRSVAVYTGTNTVPYPASTGMANAFTRAIGTPMFFTSNTIDQPGKQIASAAHGHWMGGDLDFEQCDVWLLVGINPIITKSAGIPGQNPAQKLKEAVARGMRLIVIDPRLSDTARKAAVHLRPRPGEDAAILAGLLRVILEEDRYDHAFVDEHVGGLEALRAAVAPFTPDYVAARADIPAEQLIEAARLFAAGRGMVNTGTGPSFSRHCNLVDYLALCLNSVCGRWPRAGEQAHRPNAMLPPAAPKAQAFPPYKGWGYGERMRVRGLTDAVCGMPTAALAEEILMDGDGQVKALICVGSNPMAAWPDQRKTQQAMEKLELLVTLDVEPSLTARMADYVIATQMTLETPGMSQMGESMKYFVHGLGFPGAYAQYSERVVEPPAGSELIEEWEFFHGLASRLALPLDFVSYFGSGRYQEAPSVVVRLSPNETFTTEALFERMCSTSRIPLEEVKRHPHGKCYEVECVIAPCDPDCNDRLDVGNQTLLGGLAELTGEDFEALHNTPAYPLRLVPRRLNNFMNSAAHSIDKLHGGKPYNPAWMHPQDMAVLGLADGDQIEIATAFDAIPGVVEQDDSLRPGLVAMSHAFGGLVNEDERFLEIGSSTGRLTRTDVDYDPITGMPRLGNIPIKIRPLNGGVRRSV